MFVTSKILCILAAKGGFFFLFQFVTCQEIPLIRKFLSKNTKCEAQAPFWKHLNEKFKFWALTLSSVGNLQLFVRKFRLATLRPTFLIGRLHYPANVHHHHHHHLFNKTDWQNAIMHNIKKTWKSDKCHWIELCPNDYHCSVTIRWKLLTNKCLWTTFCLCNFCYQSW